MQGPVSPKFQAGIESLVMDITTPVQKWGNFHIKRYSCWHKAYVVKKKLLQEVEVEF